MSQTCIGFGMMMNFKTKSCSFVIVAGLIGSGGALAQQSSSRADMSFASKAAVGGMEEVELGKIAAQKGTSDKVKTFGQRMVDDHTKAGNELKDLAAKKNMTLPSDLDPKAKAMVAKFSNMKAGSAFDKAYMAAMVKDHHEDVAEFQKEANGGSDTDLKTWAATTLPTLQDHLKMAEEGTGK